ncbi:MAG: hypothetical protein HQM14_03630 [SAR324 cluster bacterium]|nr:hypothetical protein [SAR324 cluster bacterium]
MAEATKEKAPAPDNKKAADPPKKGGKKAAVEDSLDIPEKFKEEDRVFIGSIDFRREEKERGIMGKMLGLIMYGSLKVTLDHLEAMIKKNAFSEGALDQHLRHYLKRGEREVCGSLRCITQMLLQRTRDTDQTTGSQVVLMFKAIDCLRMIVQYSPSAVDNLPTFMILQIMAKMPGAFVPHMNREKQIFNHTLGLQRAIKEGLPTINVRNKLANLYMKQKCYADVLYQYENMLGYFQSKKPQTPADKEKTCVIHLNIADMYKDIYNFKGEFKNGQILQNFIFRNNRDADIMNPSRHKISEITGPVNKLTVSQVYKDLKQFAVEHYEEALKLFPKNKNLKKRSDILVTLGKTYAEMGKANEAADRLQDSLLILGKERNSPEMFKNKEDILTLMREAVPKLAAGPKKEKLKSFIVKEENKLESDQLEWEEQEQRKKNLQEQAEKGTKKKI